jgi:penicillin-binding protein 1A
MLAGLFKAPTKYAPHVNLPAARARADDVLNNMVEAGFLTEGQIYAAQRNPATPVARQTESSPDWYLDWAFDEVKRLAAANKLGADRVLTVRTALDLGLQRRAEQVIEDQLREFGPSYHVKQSATVILEPLGAVRAIVGGRDYGTSQFNRATEATRQPGSSFKPFVYLTALLSGKFKPTTIVLDAPICIGNWCPRNFGNSYMGNLPLVSALAHSLNTVAVRLSIAIGDGDPKRGRAKIIETARKMGLTTPLPDTPSLPIGADDVTVIDMASAYSTFANGGRRAPPYAVVDVTNGHGDMVYRHDRDAPAPQQIFNPAVITDMVGMMRQVVEAGTGRRAQLDHIPVAGKTGTTNGSKDAWFIGYTGNYVGAVWFGNDDDTPTAGMTGGTVPASTWHDIMTYAHQGIELKPLPGAPPPVQPSETVASQGVTQTSSAPQRPATLGVPTLSAVASIGAAMKAVEHNRNEVQAGVSFANDEPVGPAASPPR